MANTERVKKGFNFLSGFYDFFSRLFFGNAILRSQVYFLPSIGKFKNVLIFGGGTGKILMALLRYHTGENYCYVDISEKMIAKAKKRVYFTFPSAPARAHPPEEKITFTCGSYTDLPGTHFDLIITPYVLDCFSEKELPEVMKALHAKLSPGGKWLFADFNVPQKGGMKFFSKLVISILYFIFNIITGIRTKKLPAFDNHFSAQGMVKEKEHYFLRGMLTAKIYRQP